MTALPTMPAMDHLVLAKRLDLTEAAMLQLVLLEQKGKAVTLNADKVLHLGGLCLQVLLAAAADWRQRGLRLHIEPRSAAFDSALCTFAVPLSALQSETGL